MTLTSRFSTAEKRKFEFSLPDDDTYHNQRPHWIPLVAFNFNVAPTSPGNIPICIKDEQGEDLIWTENPQGKQHLRRIFGSPIPIASGSKIGLYGTSEKKRMERK